MGTTKFISPLKCTNGQNSKHQTGSVGSRARKRLRTNTSFSLLGLHCLVLTDSNLSRPNAERLLGNNLLIVL